jgi:hypothetical protein
MEGGCECSVREEVPGSRASLDVAACVFYDVLSAEGKPQLLANLCCQHNASWLRAYEGAGVDARLAECLAAGGRGCRIEIEAAAPGGGGRRA